MDELLKRALEKDSELLSTGSIVYNFTGSLHLLHYKLNKELSQDWKSYTITINDQTHELNPECEPEMRNIVIKQLLKDAACSYIDGMNNDSENGTPVFTVINRILSGARKEDHQFEIVKEAIVTNLDADGNPITAKPLNEDSVYVQWQDQNKFKFEDENV